MNLSTIAHKFQIILNCYWLHRKYFVSKKFLLNKVLEKQIFYFTCIQTQDIRHNTYHLYTRIRQILVYTKLWG